MAQMGGLSSWLFLWHICRLGSGPDGWPVLLVIFVAFLQAWQWPRWVACPPGYFCGTFAGLAVAQMGGLSSWLFLWYICRLGSGHDG